MVIDILTMVDESARNEIIYPCIDRINSGIIVEIGTFLGGNLCRMAEYAKLRNKSIIFYGIDNFSFDYINQDKYGCGGTDILTKISSFEQCYQNVLLYNLTSNVRIIPSDSLRGSNFFDDNSIDLIFFDSVHTYEYLTSELNNWYDKIKIGGVISGHDYQMLEVQKAVTDFFGTCIIHFVSDFMSYWIIK